jgi:hypothetical protein
MPDRYEQEAEAIVDRFVADDGPADLLTLQHAIAAAIRKEAGYVQRGQLRSHSR